MLSYYVIKQALENSKGHNSGVTPNIPLTKQRFDSDLVFDLNDPVLNLTYHFMMANISITL
jgi:hypothetical protein